MVPTIDFDQLTADMSEQQLGVLLVAIIRRMIEKFGASLPITIRDENQRPIATVVPVEEFVSEEEANSEFVRVLKKRAADPDQKLLSADEFLAAISRK